MEALEEIVQQMRVLLAGMLGFVWRLHGKDGRAQKSLLLLVSDREDVIVTALIIKQRAVVVHQDFEHEWFVPFFFKQGPTRDVCLFPEIAFRILNQIYFETHSF
jgi:hypothetical protein